MSNIDKISANEQLFTELTPEEGAMASGGLTILRLNYFEVTDNQEWPRDEPFLKDGTRKIWSKGGVGIGNHSVNIDLVIDTGSSKTLSLFEDDSFSKDEWLGSNTFYDGVNGSNLQAVFNRKGARYVLHYDSIAV